ncbi:MAG: hypothetical protein SRB2_04240 [Desulfobacteraceae bacterium Eth-SRB2]|nr:MAG: hypothetical protein SRB2_04240 [Desulfobacteraceae bacterium Eth-SRB2]
MMSGLGFNAFEEKRYRIGSCGRTFYLWEDPKARELFDPLNSTRKREKTYVLILSTLVRLGYLAD